MARGGEGARVREVVGVGVREGRGRGAVERGQRGPQRSESDGGLLVCRVLLACFWLLGFVFFALVRL